MRPLAIVDFADVTHRKRNDDACGTFCPRDWNHLTDYLGQQLPQ